MSNAHTPPNVPANRLLEPGEDPDGFDGDGNWKEWDRRVGPFEPDLAEQLDRSEVGDTLSIQIGEERELEFRYIDRRPGVTEIRMDYEMTCWVVRGKYVFITARGVEKLIMGSWYIEPERREDWSVGRREVDE